MNQEKIDNFLQQASLEYVQNIQEIHVIEGKTHKFAFVLHHIDGIESWASYVDYTKLPRECNGPEEAMIYAVGMAYTNEENANKAFNLAILGIA